MMNMNILKNKIDNIIRLSLCNTEKAEHLADKLEESISVENMNLLFEDLSSRKEDEYLNFAYIDIWLGIIYDPKKKNTVFELYCQQEDGLKIKFKIMLNTVLKDFKEISNNGGFKGLEDFENPYKVVECFCNQL